MRARRDTLIHQSPVTYSKFHISSCIDTVTRSLSVFDKDVTPFSLFILLCRGPVSLNFQGKHLYSHHSGPYYKVNASLTALVLLSFRTNIDLWTTKNSKLCLIKKKKVFLFVLGLGHCVSFKSFVKSQSSEVGCHLCKDISPQPAAEPCVLWLHP